MYSNGIFELLKARIVGVVFYFTSVFVTYFTHLRNSEQSFVFLKTSDCQIFDFWNFDWTLWSLTPMKGLNYLMLCIPCKDEDSRLYFKIEFLVGISRLNIWAAPPPHTHTRPFDRRVTPSLKRHVTWKYASQHPSSNKHVTSSSRYKVWWSIL